MNTNTLGAANIARANKVLQKLIRTIDYGVVTYQEYVIKRLVEGGRVATALIEDTAKRARLEREYAVLNRGFNVPWENECHPTTIKVTALKAQLAGSITCIEYRLYAPGDAHWSVIPKMVYDFACSPAVILDAKARIVPNLYGECAELFSVNRDSFCEYCPKTGECPVCDRRHE